ncbi:DUF167 domain-containing protein [Patescibacteria group bacterium]
MIITVKAKAGSRENKIEEIGVDEFRVSVTEPPVQGRANNAIIELLADHFEVTQSNIRLTSGFRSREKTFEINK